MFLFSAKATSGMSAIAFAVSIVIRSPSLSQTTTPRPCDIYGSAGTPCVAAHSMVRALYAAYNGPVYQVRRSLDNNTRDIGLLSRGGYTNAAAQDSFCSGTSCFVTKIYDQSPSHNDLLQANKHLAQADALPITIAGHNVYGLKIVHSNMGYGRHTSDGPLTGTATGSQPEGEYMVTSASFVNNECCFDYGNTEAKITDNGNGHMDAISFGQICLFPTCLGIGPWVGADMESGVFYSDVGIQKNPADTGITYQFVTAMIKNNGTSFWARKTANAQSGGLTTWFSGPLPTVSCCGGHGPYSPMQKEGGITLGQGGDGSSGGDGEFFEGAMVLGLPSDATDNAVQANIVRVRYTTRHQ